VTFADLLNEHWWSAWLLAAWAVNAGIIAATNFGPLIVINNKRDAP